jgi:hypothetical protein
VLFPWLPVGSIGEADLDGLRVLAAATPAFDAELVTLGRFPKVAWLAPAPSEAFAALTRTASTHGPCWLSTASSGARRRGSRSHPFLSPEGNRRGTCRSAWKVWNIPAGQVLGTS